MIRTAVMGSSDILLAMARIAVFTDRHHLAGGVVFTTIYYYGYIIAFSNVVNNTISSYQQRHWVITILIATSTKP